MGRPHNMMCNRMDRIALMLVMVLAGCGQETLAKTWPEVADKHWFAFGLLISWLALCLVGLVRGFGITIKQQEPTK